MAIANQGRHLIVTLNAEVLDGPKVHAGRVKAIQDAVQEAFVAAVSQQLPGTQMSLSVDSTWGYTIIATASSETVSTDEPAPREPEPVPPADEPEVHAGADITATMTAVQYECWSAMVDMGEKVSVAALARRLGTSPAAASQRARRLVQAGAAESAGHGAYRAIIE